MITCANCVSEASWNYLGTKYCDKHLPRFLRNRDGSVKESVKLVAPASEPTVLFPEVAAFVEEKTVVEETPVVKETVVVEDTPKIDYKKKTTPKA